VGYRNQRTEPLVRFFFLYGQIIALMLAFPQQIVYQLRRVLCVRLLFRQFMSWWDKFDVRLIVRRVIQNLNASVVVFAA
jgi:hypothetical protein